MRLSGKKICVILDTLTVMAICISVFIAMTRTVPRSPLHLSRSEFPVKGIDISAHNGSIDFALVAADSVDFVIMKATEGTDFCDAKFNIYYQDAKANNLHVGAYHFFRFETPGAEQASHFINTVAGKDFNLPLAIDVEQSGNHLDQTITKVKRELHAMVDSLRSAGYPVMIYTNKKDRAKYIDSGFDDVPVWICSLSFRPSMPGWHYWQHSHHGRVRGISGYVDINTCNPDIFSGTSPVTSFTVDPQ